MFENNYGKDSILEINCDCAEGAMYVYGRTSAESLNYRKQTVHHDEVKMSFMKGDLLTKTRRLIKGGIITKKPLWFDAVSHFPPQAIRVRDGKAPKIELPEDRLIKAYFARHPEARCQAFDLNSFEPPVARKFAWRVLEFLDRGFAEDWARDIVEADLAAEEKAKRKRDMREGRPLPKSAIEEAQEEDWANMASGVRNMQTRGSSNNF
ncbi:hypothetical protein R1flu_020101 [Riccia fluitans]|uniref:Small ribosomal subunit protein mS23 n=1 Tax=Riccia fluitans TaxID=41844 RepID=A0ABD1ZKM5_9MARC